MDIRNIEYFLHLAKYEHVSATADLLHISQPSLSKHITSLEREIGVKLFDRSRRHVSLNRPRGAFRSLILPMPPLSRTVSPSTPRSIP